MTPIPSQLTSRHVAVIGAGAAGLVAARELRREGHRVVVFEHNNEVGGTWVYTPHYESDHLGLDPNRHVIHTSLYASLRTNLPREVMGFKDFPFTRAPKKKEEEEEEELCMRRDPRRFPGHQEVLAYLKDFAREFRVEELVRFETQVVEAGIVKEEEEGLEKKWKVRSKRKRIDGSFEVSDEIYDAVVVCNGHFTEPRVAQVPGISSWPGKQMHSHNYRTPEPFAGQVVVLIGNSSSAVDISRELAGVAKEVHVAARAFSDDTFLQQPGYENMWLHSMIERANEDGSLVFRNGRLLLADIILHCTGYKYDFPFFEVNDIVTVDDNRVGPLYKHVFPPSCAPWLSFVGLPWKVVPFTMFEFQSKWIAGVLSGRILLPSVKEMLDDVKAFYLALEASHVPQRYTHYMGDTQFEYDNWLAAQCGCSKIETWRELMYRATSQNKLIRPDTYRDEWEDDQLVLEAYKDFAKYSTMQNLLG